MPHHLPDPDMQPEFYADVTVKRGLAFVVDTLLIVALVALVVVLTAFTGLFVLPLLFGAVGMAYRIVTLANGSATPGMRLLAIEFRDADGRPFALPQAVWHTLGFTVCLMFPLLQLVSVVLMLTDDRGRGLVDRMLGTAAMNRRARY